MTRERRFALEAGGRRRRVARRAPAAAPRRAGPRPRPGPASGPTSTRATCAIAVDNLRHAFPDWDEARVLRTARGVYAPLRPGAPRHPLDAGPPARGAAGARRRRGPRARAGRARRGARGRHAPPRTSATGSCSGVALGCALRPVGGGGAPARQPGPRRAARRVPRLERQHRHLQAAGPRAGPAHAARAAGVVAIVIDQNVQATTASSWTSSAGRPATTTVAAALARQDGCPIVPGALRAARRRALPHAPTSPPVAWPRRARRDEDIARADPGAHARHRGLGARAPRAVAVAAPAVEDAAARPAASASEDRSRCRGRARPRARARTGSATSCCRCPRCATCAATSPPRGSRCWRGRGWPSSTGAVAEVDAVRREPRRSRADVGGAARAPSTSACCCPNSFGAALVALAAPASPSAGATRPTAAGRCSRARCRVPREVRGRSQVYYYRAMLAGLGLARDGAARRLARAAPRTGRARGRALLGDDGPLARRQPRGLLRHRQALAARALRRRGRPRGPAHRRARRDRRRRRRAAARRGDRGAAAERPRASCAARRRSPSSWACSRELRLLLTNDSGPCTSPPRSARRSWPSSARPTGGRPRPSRRARALVREDAECAPCKLRECPIDHRCMTRVARRPRGRGARWSSSRHEPEPRPAIFMDRDGTLSHEVGYVNHLVALPPLPLDGGRRAAR